MRSDLQAGATIVEEGTEAEYVYYIVHGMVRVVKGHNGAGNAAKSEFGGAVAADPER
eukprot:SAG22_NODE_428_length_10591_cov_8.858178_8_plen_57_part_00